MYTCDFNLAMLGALSHNYMWIRALPKYKDVKEKYLRAASVISVDEIMKHAYKLKGYGLLRVSYSFTRSDVRYHLQSNTNRYKIIDIPNEIYGIVMPKNVDVEKFCTNLLHDYARKVTGSFELWEYMGMDDPWLDDYKAQNIASDCKFIKGHQKITKKC